MQVARTVHVVRQMKSTPLRDELTTRLQILLHRYCTELQRTTRELAPQIAEHVAALRALDMTEPKTRDSSPEIQQ